jgi:hypothetical protein
MTRPSGAHERRLRAAVGMTKAQETGSHVGRCAERVRGIEPPLQLGNLVGPVPPGWQQVVVHPI